MTLVVDASVAIAAVNAADGLAALGSERLAAPALMWSEARSTLHLWVWQRRVSRADGEVLRDRLEQLEIELCAPETLGEEAWRVAHELGWARTYDAEYVALARLLDCRLVTVDARLRRGADRLGFVVGPLEL